MRLPTVWIVLEIHSYPPTEGQVSVWISGRPLSDNKLIEEDIAVKLVGPVLHAEGERVIQVLREQLEVAGVTLVESATADD